MADDRDGAFSLVMTIAVSLSAVFALMAFFVCMGPLLGYPLTIITGLGFLFVGHWLLWGRTMPTEVPDESHSGGK